MELGAGGGGHALGGGGLGGATAGCAAAGALQNLQNLQNLQTLQRDALVTAEKKATDASSTEACGSFTGAKSTCCTGTSAQILTNASSTEACGSGAWAARGGGVTLWGGKRSSSEEALELALRIAERNCDTLVQVCGHIVLMHQYIHAYM